MFTFHCNYLLANVTNFVLQPEDHRPYLLWCMSWIEIYLNNPHKNMKVTETVDTQGLPVKRFFRFDNIPGIITSLWPRKDDLYDHMTILDKVTKLHILYRSMWLSYTKIMDKIRESVHMLDNTENITDENMSDSFGSPIINMMTLIEQWNRYYDMIDHYVDYIDHIDHYPDIFDEQTRSIMGEDMDKIRAITNTTSIYVQTILCSSDKVLIMSELDESINMLDYPVYVHL